jgi:hypothetical protein
MNVFSSYSDKPHLYIGNFSGSWTPWLWISEEPQQTVGERSPSSVGIIIFVYVLKRQTTAANLVTAVKDNISNSENVF